MTKIKNLTQNQIDNIPHYVEKWKKIGLSTELVNLEKAKKAVIRAYENVGLPAPTQFYVADSPIHAIKLIQSIDPSISEKDIFSNMAYGNHNADWLAFYDYMQTELGLDLSKIDPITELSQHTGWISFYEDVVVFQHRPEIIKFDDQHRLHSDSGSAIRYRDGFSVYAWHGTSIPSEWIENKNMLTAKIALTWENVEQRRAACEILGWAKVLNSLDSTVIDEDGDPEIGTLLEVNIPEIGKEKFLKVLCGTRREFALPVPPEMKTALEANAWTFGFEAKDFIIPEVRT